MALMFVTFSNFLMIKLTVKIRVIHSNPDSGGHELEVTSNVIYFIKKTVLL